MISMPGFFHIIHSDAYHEPGDAGASGRKGWARILAALTGAADGIGMGAFLAAVSFLNILLTKVYFLYIVYLYNKYS